MSTLSSQRLWGIVILSMASATIALHFQSLSLDISGTLPFIALCLSAIAIASLAGRFTNPAIVKLIDLSEGLGLFATIGAVGAVMSYAIAAGSRGYVDAGLAQADQALGFDWLHAYSLIEGSWPISRIMTHAYENIFWSPLILIVLHVWHGDVARLRSLLCVFALCLFVTIALFHWFPARSAVPHYLGSLTSYRPPSGWPTETIDALRDRKLTVVDIAHPIGLITFPSFHAAAAVIFIWGAWPFRTARKILIPVNLLMIVATPIKGSHYLIDVIAGASLALACIAFAYLGRERDDLHGIKRRFGQSFGTHSFTQDSG